MSRLLAVVASGAAARVASADPARPAMTRRPAPLVLLATALLILPACDFGGSDAVGITGRWEGQVTDAQDGAQSYDLTLRLSDNGRSVAGTGELDLPDGPFLFSVVGGTFVQGQVNLPVQSDRLSRPGSITGVLTQTDPGEITGDLTAPGVAGGPLVVELRAR